MNINKSIYLHDAYGSMKKQVAAILYVLYKDWPDAILGKLATTSLSHFIKHTGAHGRVSIVSYDSKHSYGT